MRSEIHIVIPGEPVPLERHRSRIVTTRHGQYVQFYETKWMHDMKLYIQRHAIRTLRGLDSMQPLSGPLHLTLYFGMVKPKSRDRARPLPDSKPDFDNLTKLVCDALNGIVWMDDAQVTDCIVKKRYDVTPRTEIVVRHLTAAEAVA